MAEHELPPMRGILSLTSRLSALAPVAGAAVTFGTLGVASMAAAVLIGVLATFIAFAGLLSISDWQADVQTRQEWARLGLTPVHLSSAAELARESDLDPRYLAPSSNEALQQVFRVYRVEAQTTCSVPALERSASVLPAPDHVSDVKVIPKADSPKCALPKVVSTRAATGKASSWKERSRAKVMAVRVRLVVNGATWPERLAPIPRSIDKAADIIVLSGRRREQVTPLPEASVVSNDAESTEPVSLYSATSNSDTSAPRRVGRRVVTDNLGPKIPITSEELDAIETYLEADLRKLFSSRKSGGAPEDI